MKFWQRIYILFLTLFILTFSFAGILIIEKIHNETLKREVDRCLSEHLSIYSGVNLSIPVYDTLRRYSRNTSSDDEILSNAINDYYKKYNDKNVYVEILDTNNKSVFSNMNFKMPDKREEINSLQPDKRQYIIKDIGNKSYIFISNLININNKSYKFTYARNISGIYKERGNQYVFFFKLDVVVSLVFMAFMYFASKYITKPIQNLIGATKRIVKGNFSEKVEIKSKDEFGVLAENFNTMAEVVEEKINELERNNNEKQRFIDNLAHELKTPLTSIIGYANLLRTTKYNEEIFIDGLGYIYGEGKRLEELSFRLMDLILLRKEEFKLQNESIKNIVLEVKGSLLPKLIEKNISLVIEDNDFEMMMQRDLMKVLLTNLIDNAIKASKVKSEIHIGINKYKYEVEIKDHGIGIAKEHIDKIFEPFYMVDKARTRASNGAGLGLSICKKILDIHSGCFVVESEIDKGTSIKLIFNTCKGGDSFHET
ncbi:HAMP domain-containing histidine kinase [Clostridium sp. CM028]|uniref:HAMP domain-containing sensor histidine kinase n=1 Tax=unclassified Clostridium TaxID=2614128 RepID=UPI001C0B9B81|nr:MULTISPECIES: HAMP domain-containing sensor histidine kinase [unclassified Clostridium]MBU3092768.1 HAMP domain-containing histidine kinase [Clostridium sp. CF011]MBW9145772.1 HAMP domain-containing histidine kinase [Clostridium sp. CM027]MBW9150608.1 HAMP domain-containing histidine kinase [Clostridium sp. CM028]UVE42163.1 HAMP domain-containing histidine kinase [Clostridium sp. CM027]WAG71188.1 HAMP domain-containing histidine kinase [Clostridium sp. CF011]